MPSTSESRVSVSKESAATSPLLYLGNVELGGQPSSARSSVVESSQARAIEKNVRNAGADNRRRTAGSSRMSGGRGAHVSAIAGAGGVVRMWTNYSIYGVAVKCAGGTPESLPLPPARGHY